MYRFSQREHTFPKETHINLYSIPLKNYIFCYVDICLTAKKSRGELVVLRCRFCRLVDNDYCYFVVVANFSAANLCKTTYEIT